MISDKELEQFRLQAEFNSRAFSVDTSQTTWRKLAEALQELKDRRAKDKQLEQV